MNHELLKSIILDQQEFIKKIHIVPRNIPFDEKANYVVVGIRRAGKSTLLYKQALDLVSRGVQWNQIIFINFEDERLCDFSASDFKDILEIKSECTSEKGYFFFDEIQNIPGWEKFARRMADIKETVYITGSNAQMLSSEIETTLGGRYFTKHVSPYSFKEFLTAKGIPHSENDILTTKTRGVIKGAFREYMKFGGFPESLLYDDKRGYVSSIYQKILLGDIAARHGIRNFSALKIMMKKIAESIKDELSYSKLFNILKTIGIKTSKDILIDYISYAKDAFLLFSVQNYYAKFAEKESSPKYYFSDNGLANLFLTNKDSLLLENLVAVNLFKKYDGEIYYLKSAKTGIDIDFYIPEEGRAVQVAYSLQNISSGREVSNLVKLHKVEKSVQQFVIITFEEEDEITQNGCIIQVVPVWKWLLQL